MKATVNTNLFPIVNVGMYNTILSPDSLFCDGEIDNDHENGENPYDSEYFNDNFLMSEYESAVQKLAGEVINGQLEKDGIIVTLKAGEIYSPKYYNFMNDNMDIEVTYNKGKILKYANAHKDDIDKFLRATYKSYDGFINLMPSYYSEWEENFKQDEQRSIGAFLTYLFYETFEHKQQELEIKCYDSLFYSQFCDESNLENVEN